MALYEDFYWQSADGLKLHARDYAGGRDGRPPILCLPGLTRNARDWEPVAERLAGAWRVIAVDLRGRGRSEYARDATTYVPPTYVGDVAALLDELGVGRFVAFGTSLGGIVTMLMAAAMPGRIAGALLNDVGPVIEPAGLGRIRTYVGRASSLPTWMHAARCAAETHGDAHPGWQIEDWLAMAKRLYRLNSGGRVVLDYDLRIAEPFRMPGNEAAPDLWGSLAALGPAPVLVVRGERSDILSAATAEAMVASLGRAGLATVPGVGHAPTLTEPGMPEAIDGLLATVLEQEAR